MANYFTTQAKIDFIDGVHQPGDTYKLALYTSMSGLGDSTTAYTTTNESSGTGYSAGGVELQNRQSGTSGVAAYMTFDNVVLESATLSAACGMIYNASKSNKAIAILDFGGTQAVTNGTLTIEFPAAGANAIIRIV